MTKFKKLLNFVSQVGEGDRSLRVDKMDITITRFNGASGYEQKYHTHKDSYRHDPNNEVHGMDLRKLSLVIFMNDDLDKIRESPLAKMGSLRLFTKGDTYEGVVDIIPRIGRAILFKSEEVLHKFMPTLGWDNWVFTTYFT